MIGHERFLQETLGAMDLVYNLARRMAPTRQDAEDLVQETYLRAYRAWVAHRRPRKVEPWLATICLNVGRSMRRQRARRPAESPLEDAAVLPARGDTEEDALAALEREEVHEALRRLPEPQRVAITLVDMDGFSTAEAARIMGVPRGTVLSRLHRGRKALGGLLGDHVEDRET